MSVNDEQPPPKVGTAPHSVDLVVMDLAERKRMGTAKYGTPHAWDNGRDGLIDALQEAYDLSIYLRAEVEKQKAIRELADQLPCERDCSVAATGKCDCVTGRFQKLLGVR